MSFFARYTPFVSNGGGGGSGVTSLNSLTGALNLVAGTNITITPSGSNITIDATSGSSHTLIDNSSVLSVDGINRQLVFTDGTTDMLDWATAGTINYFGGGVFTALTQPSNFWGANIPGMFVNSTTIPSPASQAFFFSSTDVTTGPSVVVGLISGDNTSTGANADITGDVYISSGFQNNSAGTGSSGNIFMSTGGNAGSGDTGEILMNTGGIAGSAGNSGQIQLVTGDSQSANSGPILIMTGHAPNGTRSDIRISGENVSIDNGKLMAPVGVPSFTIQTQDNNVAGTRSVLIMSGNSTTSLTGDAQLESGDGTASGRVVCGTGAASNGASGEMRFATGNANGASGQISLAIGAASNNHNTGDVLFTIPAASGTGVTGSIKFQDGSQGTANSIWMSKDTLGSGTWYSGGAGVSGTFTTADAKTVTVTNGIITSIV